MNEKFFVPHNNDRETKQKKEITINDLEKATCPNCGTEVVLDETSGECHFCREHLKNDEEE